jgi:hypothetical protein
MIKIELDCKRICLNFAKNISFLDISALSRHIKEILNGKILSEVTIDKSISLLVDNDNTSAAIANAIIDIILCDKHRFNVTSYSINKSGIEIKIIYAQ